MKKFLLSMAVLAAVSTMAQNVATFEDVNIPSGDYWTGTYSKTTPTGTFTSGDYSFEYFNGDSYGYATAAQFAVSKSTNTDASFKYTGDQYSAITGKGVKDSKQYAVIYYDAYNGHCRAYTKDQAKGAAVTGSYITNESYVAKSITKGNAYESAFATGDWLLLTATATKADKSTVTATKYLADFRSSETSQQTYLKDWSWFDFSSFGNDVLYIDFSITGSHTGNYGLNTPAYFCMDDFGGKAPLTPATFEDVSIANGKTYFNGAGTDDKPITTFNSGSYTFPNFNNPSWPFWCEYAVSKSTATTYNNVSDQYNNVTGKGANNSEQYAVVYDGGSMMGPGYENTILMPDQTAGNSISGCYITNTAWVKKAILEGDGMTGAFTTGDYLKFTATAKLADNTTRTIDFYLADYRSSVASEHYYVDSWKWFDMSSFGNNVLSVSFAVTSTHKNNYGITTPTYFCMDDFGGNAPQTPSSIDNTPFSQGLKTVKSVSYYSIDGRMLTEPQQGMNIIITRYTDGTATSKKIIKK